MKKIYLILFGILINFSLIFAKDCGGDIECQCGDLIVEDYLMKENLFCEGDALSFKNSRKLDCNGHRISGNGSGKGISIVGNINYGEVNNCFISNFTEGIYFNRLKQVGVYNYPNWNSIYNNIFKDNYVGIYYQNVFGSNQIFDNFFRNNTKAGIKIGGANNGFIWNNSFHNSGIFYETIPAVKFCHKNSTNYYFDGAIGPDCDCFVPYDNLKITSSINLCEGEYFLPNGIGAYTTSSSYRKNIRINCKNTHLIGNGSNSGITIAGIPDALIDGCIISNYENGIQLTWAHYWSTYSKHTYNSVRTDITNNIISNVKTGIDLITYASIDENYNNTITLINDSFEIKRSKIYLDIKLQPSILDGKLTSYLESNIDSELLTKDISEANVIIEVGDFNTKYLFDKFLPILDRNPYSAQIISNKTKIQILSKGSIGYIVAVKELVKNFENYLFVDNIYLVNDSNLEAIGIYDYLNNNYNKKYYNKDVSKFGILISNVLDNNMFNFEEFFIPISLGNNSINYKIWHFESNKSSLLKSYVDKDGFPIVMAGGLWSNITTWQKLGKELANEGFDVYLLEFTGGNNSECSICYNYFYENLTNVVYPNYVNYVLNHSQNSKIKYVGHSNGARVAVDSLFLKNIDSEIIDTLILVGIPGAFEDSGLIGKSVGVVGKNLEINISHVSMVDLLLDGLLKNKNSTKISFNLWSKYLTWINSNEDIQPGKNLSVGKAMIIGGYLSSLINNDGIVTLEDERKIYNNLDSKNKYLFFLNSIHVGMSEDRVIMHLIKKFVKNEEFTKGEKLFYLEENGN